MLISFVRVICREATEIEGKIEICFGIKTNPARRSYFQKHQPIIYLLGRAVNDLYLGMTVTDFTVHS